ncbi:hypothetical protein GBF38_010917 [Nibea albiflora]|uniref:Uncharacterized protein n=1 Tax=Nibea albiflora TaxID=240163 RepID=A0ACB7ESL9_NIBAL|nr:hypothetical protein GBF38_010917 [Nibea albiflora]
MTKNRLVKLQTFIATRSGFVDVMLPRGIIRFIRRKTQDHRPSVMTLGFGHHLQRRSACYADQMAIFHSFLSLPSYTCRKEPTQFLARSIEISSFREAEGTQLSSPPVSAAQFFPVTSQHSGATLTLSACDRGYKYTRQSEAVNIPDWKLSIHRAFSLMFTAADCPQLH